MAQYYPPVGFHFKVEVLDFSNDLDTRFSEVSGLSVEMATEEVAEGGENRFVQKYPVRTKYPEVVLKRGLVTPQSELWNWAKKCMEDYTIEPKNVFIKLLNESHEPLMTWNIVGAYPNKWAVADLNASHNAVLIESITLVYQYFTVSKN